MTELDDFLTSVLPRMEAADIALHNGDVTGRAEMWSRNDPVTLFGAAFTASGWSEIGPTFEVLASRFSDCSSWRFELVSAGVSDTLAYTVGIERTTASVAGAPPSSYALRVTTIFRHENGGWKIVHRHGDPFDDSASDMAARLREPGSV